MALRTGMEPGCCCCGPGASDPGALVSAQHVQGLVSLVSRAWHRVKAAPVPRVSLELPWQTREGGGKDSPCQHSWLSAVCSRKCMHEK